MTYRAREWLGCNLPARVNCERPLHSACTRKGDHVVLHVRAFQNSAHNGYFHQTQLTIELTGITGGPLGRKEDSKILQVNFYQGEGSINGQGGKMTGSLT